MKLPLSSRPALVALVIAAWTPLSRVQAVDGTWNTTSTANYSATGNWSGGIVATGTGAVMNYLAAGNGQTITLDTPVTLGSLIFNNNSASSQIREVTFAVGAGSLTFDTGGPATALIELRSSSGTGPRNLNLGAFTVTGTKGLEIRNSATQGEQRVRFTSLSSLNGGALTLTNNQSTLLDIRATDSNPFGTADAPDVVFAGSGTTSITTSTGINLTYGTISGTNTNASLNATAGQGITFGSARSGSFAGRLTGAGTFTKSGSGVQTLTGTNTNTGSIQINAGTLLVNGQGSSAVTVSSGTLGGTGHIGGNVTVNNSGVLAPGNSAGLLGMNNLTLSGTGATLAMELSGTSAGQYDQVGVTGSVTLNGNGRLELTLLSFTPSLNDVFFLILNDGSDPINGTLFNLAQGDIFSAAGYQWQISYTGDSATNAFSGVGNDLAIMTVVPEPQAVLLCLLGLALLIGRHRRRTSALP